MKGLIFKTHEQTADIYQINIFKYILLLKKIFFKLGIFTVYFKNILKKFQ